MRNILKVQKDVFFLFVALFWGSIFFSVCSILDLNFYEGDTPLPYFMYSYMVVDLIVLFYYIKMLVIKGISKGDLVIFIVVLVVTLLYFLSTSYHIDAIMHYKVFIAESIPAMLIASYIVRQNKMAMFVKYFDVLMLFITLGLVMNLPRCLSGIVKIGGGTYQAFSYYSAFAFSLNFLGVVFRGTTNGFVIFKSSYFWGVSLFLLPLQILSCFMGGGRGAVLLIFFSVFLFLFLGYITEQKRKLIGVMIVVFLFLVLLYILPQGYIDLLFKGYDRAFSYIGENGELDMTETSNRDDIYAQSLSAVFRHPILGYGLFDYIDEIRGYPHNIVLDVLMQGGIVYALFFFSMVWILFSRLFKHSLIDYALIRFWPMALYSFTNLMFSGSYIRNPLFWFLIAMMIFFYKNVCVPNFLFFKKIVVRGRKI